MTLLVSSFGLLLDNSKSESPLRRLINDHMMTQLFCTIVIATYLMKITIMITITTIITAASMPPITPPATAPAEPPPLSPPPPSPPPLLPPPLAVK